MQENRTLRIIVRRSDANMLREYWFDNAGGVQYTLIALRRRNEAFTRLGYGNQRLSADGAGTETVVFRTGVD